MVLRASHAHFDVQFERSLKQCFVSQSKSVSFRDREPSNRQVHRDI
ncbi:hypothetical protein CEV33_4425 [Brucella grignonensis]|uniref:Uncharacterized protein n=1 Tax=Brucella grignonensis TaxID=94627 RepID=A0A256FNI0_9HYPH|nr:hypothetical protein CEV33_4425 [Brucella grignonensis]